ncbi:MAG: vWA domain-containing protein [Myxococcota bacterium]
MVFYPVGGLVYGRGLGDAVAPEASHVYIKAHPNGSETIIARQSDGTFEFVILARGGSVLEISGSTNNLGTQRGAPAYIKVPSVVFSDRDFVCCIENGASSGRCQNIDERTRQLEEDGVISCPGPESPRIECRTDIECGFEEGEYLTLNEDAIQMSSPDENGFISISGRVKERSLVTITNRGLSGIGRPEQQLRRAEVSTDFGEFDFTGVEARGDDEIIIQFIDLRGFRSPQVSMLVDDATPAGIDITGAFAFEPLESGVMGRVALQFAPYGIDGRGICPNQSISTQTCFTGGLTHDMVELTNVRVDGQEAVWSRSSTTSERPWNAGYDGDIRAGTLDVVLVIDRSIDAEAIENPATIDALRTFVRGLRQRDRVGAVVFGDLVRRLNVSYGTNGLPLSTGLFGGGERENLISAISTSLISSGAGAPRVFDGIGEAAEMLAGSTNAGRIVVLTTEEHAGTVEESRVAYDEALEKVDRSSDVTRPPIRVDIIGVALDRSDKFGDIQDTAAFTSGRYIDLAAVQPADVNQLDLVLSDLRSTLSGSFLLLYDIMIPATAGKAVRLEFGATWRPTDDDGRMISEIDAVPYSGPLRVNLTAN